MIIEKGFISLTPLRFYGGMYVGGESRRFAPGQDLSTLLREPDNVEKTEERRSIHPRGQVQGQWRMVTDDRVGNKEGRGAGWSRGMRNGSWGYKGSTGIL